MKPDESSAFTFYDRLITGFAKAADGGRPLYELGVGRRSVETVTPMKESNGVWRVSGYYIRPE